MLHLVSLYKWQRTDMHTGSIFSIHSIIVPLVHILHYLEAFSLCCISPTIRHILFSFDVTPIASALILSGNPFDFYIKMKKTSANFHPVSFQKRQEFFHQRHILTNENWNRAFTPFNDFTETSFSHSNIFSPHKKRPHRESLNL